MVVENVSNISGEMAFEALYSSIKQGNNKKYIYALVILVIGAGILMYGIFSAQSMWLTAGGIFAAFGVGLILYNLVMSFRAPKDIRKNNKEIVENGVIYTYRFREQGVDLQINCNGKRSKGTYLYSDFKRIFEYNDRFEMKLKDGDVLFVIKSGFTNDRMIEFFRKNVTLNKKLKIVKKEEKVVEKKVPLEEE